jgi:hypothetical protein
MEKLKDFLKYHDYKQSNGLLAIELRNEHDLYELYDIITPPLEPLQSKEIIKVFTSEEFSDDIGRVRELTTEENEACFTVLRWARPMVFYGSPVVLNTPVYDDNRKDRYPFFIFHSHPIGYTSIPSHQDLDVLNSITEETREEFRWKKECGHLTENFDINGFRPIMGIGSFGWTSDKFGWASDDDKEFGLLLLQLKKDANETNLSKEIIKQYEHLSISNAWDYLKNLPYNLCTLFYKWSEKNKKYILTKKSELNKLEKFALKATQKF